MTAIALCAILAVSYLQYQAFQTQIEQLAGRHASQLRNFLSSRQQKNNELIHLLKNKWQFIDSVTMLDINAILDEITPYYNQMNYGFVTLYDMQGFIIARADTPETFGNRDELTPLVLNIRDDRRAVAEAAIYNGRLALLSIERLEGTAGPIGILAAGNYLDQATMDEFAVAQDLNIILSLNDKEVVSSTVHKNIPPQAMAKRTLLDMSAQLSGTNSVKALIVDDYSAAMNKFKLNLFGVVLAMALVSAILILLSRRTVMAAARALDGARLSAEEKTAELALVNTALVEEMNERTRAVEELRQYKANLEALVARRTGELNASNELLWDDIAQRIRVEAELEKAIFDLKDALAQIKTLSGNTAHLFFLQEDPRR